MFGSIRRAAAAACAAAFVLAVAACGGGSGGGPPADGTASVTAVIRAAAVSTPGADNAPVRASMGSSLTLDGSGSTAAGGVTSYQWSVTARPAGSTAALQDATASVATFVPDVPGDYRFTLQVGNGAGTASAVLPVVVTAALPVVSINGAVQFTAPVTNVPPQSVTLGSVIWVDAAGSADSAGGPVALAFDLVAAPSGSTATLAPVSTLARLCPTSPADSRCVCGPLPRPERLRTPSTPSTSAPRRRRSSSRPACRPARPAAPWPRLSATS